jgi:hypothetical protein
MRTNIDIDDRLMRQAMRSSGEPTKRATVEAALRLLVETWARPLSVAFEVKCAGMVTWKNPGAAAPKNRFRSWKTIVVAVR